MDLNDFLKKGATVRNPNLTGNKKKDRLLPKTVQSNNIVNAYDRFSEDADVLNREQFVLTDINQPNEHWADYGVTPNRHNTYEELNKERAENQSFGEKLSRFGIRVGNEILIGSIKGFGDIYNGIANLVTDGNYETGDVYNSIKDLNDSIDERNAIYRKNPDANFDFGDSGWWFENATSVATSLSLMIPAAGWARGISMVGRVATLGKGTRLLNSVSRQFARLASVGNKATGVTAARGILNKTASISNGIKDWSSSIGMAAMSRAGENFMEAKEVYDHTLTTSRNMISNMSNDEYQKFISRNPELANMTIDEQAKHIAEQSANVTYRNDWAMLLMDVAQFKMINNIFNKSSKYAGAADRIALKNAKLRAAGVDSKDLIQNSLKNRWLERLNYGKQNPISILKSLELTEGFEEFYQGIQTEKGFEKANRYFDPNLKERDIVSYLQDGSLWNQAFWGAVGGFTFGVGGKLMAKGKHNIVDPIMAKRRLTPEDYERWKKERDVVAEQSLNDVFTRGEQLANRLSAIRDGKNPFMLEQNEDGSYKLENGSLVERDITDDEKATLTNRAINEFVTESAIEAKNNGYFDLIGELISDENFNQNVINGGNGITASDRNLLTDIKSKFDYAGNLYDIELRNVGIFNDDKNPYLNRIIASNTTKNIIRDNFLSEQIETIDNLIAGQNVSINDYTNYYNNILKSEYVKYIEQTQNHLDSLDSQLRNGMLSKEAYDRKKQEFNDKIKHFRDAILSDVTGGDINSIITELDNLTGNNFSYRNKLEQFITDVYGTLIDSNKPTDYVADLIKQRASLQFSRTFNQQYIYSTQEEYNQAYDDVSSAIEQYSRKRRESARKALIRHLTNAENLDTEVERLLQGDYTNVSQEVQDAMKMYQVYYTDSNYYNNRNNIEAYSDSNAFGRPMLTAEFAKIVSEVRKDREQVEQRDTTAEQNNHNVITNEQGNEVSQNPVEDTNEEQEETNDDTNEENEDDSNKEGQEQTQNQSLPSTGRQTESTPDVLDDVENNEPQNIPESDFADDSEEAAIQAAGEFIDYSDNTPDDSEISRLPDGYLEQEQRLYEERENIKDELTDYISRVIMHKVNNVDGYAEAIFDDNVDTNTMNNIINSLQNELVNEFINGKGYDANLVNSLINETIAETLYNIIKTYKSNPFVRRAKNVAMGYNEANDSIQHSNTKLLESMKLEEEIVSMFEEFANEVPGITLKDGKILVNVESFFNHLLTNPEFNEATIGKIYNNIKYYLTNNTNAKLVFTGNMDYYFSFSPIQFFNYIKENKQEVLNAVNNLHIDIADEYKTDKDFDNFILEVYDNGNVEFEADPSGNHINVYGIAEINGKTERKRIGFVRTIVANPSNTGFTPRTHVSGWRNKIDIVNGKPVLDSEPLFNALIERNTPEAQELFDVLQDYNMKVRDIINRINSRQIKAEQANKELKSLITDDLIKVINTNPIIKNLVADGAYILKGKTQKEQIANLVEQISNIAFSNRINSDNINSTKNWDYNISPQDMRDSYNLWKEKLLTNARQLVDIQKVLSKQNSYSIGSLYLKHAVMANFIENKEDYINTAEAGYEVNPNSPNYTPMVYVDSNLNIRTEDGNIIGKQPDGISTHSIGFLIGDNKGQPIIAYLSDAQPIDGSPIYDVVKQELRNIIYDYLNVSPENSSKQIVDIKNRINDLFKQGLFNFKDITGYNFALSIKDGNLHINKRGQDGKAIPLISFWSEQKGNKVNNISILNTSNNKRTLINGRQENVIKEQIDNIIDIITDGLTLNRSSKAFGVGTNTNNHYFNRNGGTFNVNIGGKNFVYRNYADFILQHRGFLSSVDGHKGFLKRFVSTKGISVDVKTLNNKDNITVTSNNESQSRSSHPVRDLVESKKNNKSINTVDILKVAGVSQDKIDLLMGTYNNVKLVSDKIKLFDGRDNTITADTNAFWRRDKTGSNIYITDTGIDSIDNEPNRSKRAINLILHENIHRLLHSKQYNDTQRNRIMSELKEVYNYVIEQLDKDIAKNDSNKQNYQDIKDFVTKITENGINKQSMEEFLVESLTQTELANYLNNTQYKYKVDIDSINDKSKSFLQKVIDIILKLIGLDTKIKNNSILAEQYLILSRADNTNSFRESNDIVSPLLTETNESDNVSLPVEGKDSSRTNPILQQTEDKLNEIREYYSSRISRSETFNEDHIYILDGDSQIDTSVTSVINPDETFSEDSKQKYFPATRFGNNFDDAAREYFQGNQDGFSSDFTLPNMQDENVLVELEQDLGNIRRKLDEIYGGREHYKVITDDVIVGGLVTDKNGNTVTVAGTTDMIVVTDSGEIHIYDFKTKRNGVINDSTKQKYSKQVNTYAELIMANFPDLRGKVKPMGLFVAEVNYEVGNDTNKVYSEDSNIKNQILVNGVPIQESGVDYDFPFINTSKDWFVEVKQSSLPFDIRALPEQGNTNSQKENNVAEDVIEQPLVVEDNISEPVEIEDDFDNNIDYSDDFESELDEYDDSMFSRTNLLKTATDIKVDSYLANPTNSQFGTMAVSNMDEYLRQFPLKNRADIEQMLNAGLLNYLCS